MVLLIVFDSKLLEANVSTSSYNLCHVFSLANGNAAEQAAAPVEPVRARPVAAAREGPRRRNVRRPNRGTRLGPQDDSGSNIILIK
jgi:hypothetical protein